MGRKGKRGDERFVALLQSMRASGATSSELGKVVSEAIQSGWELKTLAKGINVYPTAVRKWLEAYLRQNGSSSNHRGRRRELERAVNNEHALVLRRLAADATTSHLSAMAKWKLYLRHFECSFECFQSGNCPHGTVSYQVALRFFKSLPAAYGEPKARFSKRFRAVHPDIYPPAQTWIADRTKSDILLLKNEITGDVARFEIAAVIDRGTMTCLALSVVEREAETPKGKHYNPYFDTAAFNATIADALYGDLTGVPAKPKEIIVDWGKVENNKAFLSACNRLGIQLIRARPYDPGSKPEVEAFFRFVHSQLEAFCPGCVGSNNQSAETRPLCTESGKPKRKIDPNTGEIYWTDDAGRRLLTVPHFNKVLKEWAREWNAKIAPKWGQPRLSLFQEAAIRHDEPEELLRILLLPSVKRKIQSDGVIVCNRRFWFHPLLCLYAGFGRYKEVLVRISPDHRAWVFNLQDKPIGGSLEESQAEELLTWQYVGGSEAKLALENFQREMVRKVKRIVKEALEQGWSVDQAAARYKDELMSIFRNFKNNPFMFLPQRQQLQFQQQQLQPLEGSSDISVDEYLDLLEYVSFPTSPKQKTDYDEGIEQWLSLQEVI